MEECNYIIPAIKAARAAGIEVTGPISGDIVFLKALEGEFDVVVAQYHDQGHIPTKLVSFEEKNEEFKQKQSSNDVTKNKYKKQISDIKNDKIKNSLLELSKVYKKK